MSILYLVTNKKNGKQYVGQTKGSLSRRKFSTIQKQDVIKITIIHFLMRCENMNKKILYGLS